jgi:hypothetical protein
MTNYPKISAAVLRLALICAAVVCVASVNATNTRLPRTARGAFVPLQCPTHTAASDSVVQILKGVMASSAVGDSTFRVGIGVAGFDSSALNYVTDSVICTRLTTVEDSVSNEMTPPAVAFFSVRVGPRYLTFRPIVGNPSLWLFDTSFVLLNVISPR